MCYSAQNSLNAYIINFVSSLLLFNYSSYNQIKIIALFFIFVGQMQFFDKS